MSPMCTACTSGPANIEGHMRLLALTLGASAASFRCEQCNATWLRTTLDRGTRFTWERLDPDGKDARQRPSYLGIPLPSRITAGG